MDAQPEIPNTVEYSTVHYVSLCEELLQYCTLVQNLVPFNEELLSGDPNADGVVLHVSNAPPQLQSQRSHESVRNGDPQRGAGDPNGQTPDTNENRSSGNNSEHESSVVYL